MKSMFSHKKFNWLSIEHNDLMTLEWDSAFVRLNDVYFHLRATSWVVPMLSRHLQDSFQVPHGLVRSLVFDMLRIAKLRAIADV